MKRSFFNRLPTESIHSYLAASESRYVEATTLAESGLRTAAIYLLGYVAEMLLKAAYFRTQADRDDVDPIERNDLWQAKAEADRHGIKLANFHQLENWAEFIVATRIEIGFPLGDIIENELRQSTRIIYSHWRESIRYHETQANDEELLDVVTSVNSLRNQPDILKVP